MATIASAGDPIRFGGCPGATAARERTDAGRRAASGRCGCWRCFSGGHRRSHRSYRSYLHIDELLSLQQIRCFCAALELGSFTAAAEALRVLGVFVVLVLGPERAELLDDMRIVESVRGPCDPIAGRSTDAFVVAAARDTLRACRLRRWI